MIELVDYLMNVNCGIVLNAISDLLETDGVIIRNVERRDMYVDVWGTTRYRTVLIHHARESGSVAESGKARALNPR